MPQRFQPSSIDESMILRAIKLARKGEGLVESDPMVGSVIVRGNQIIGEGWHRRFGSPHAEVEALRSCKSNPRGATCYVTLEPCNHHGKTPPCTDALIAAGIARVVAAIRDPNPIVDGDGFAKLRRAGIKVDVGVCAEQAAELIAPFATRMLHQRPYVIAKWAQSLDGKLATRTGDSKWISGEASRRRVHQLRARVDAILVGSGTVLADDPLLTARDVPIRRTALRVVLDRRLRFPEKCRLIATVGEAPVLIFTSADKAGSARAKRLRRKGVAVESVPLVRGALSLQSILRLLASRDVTNLLVEGGPTILSAFLDQRLVDEAHVFVAPKLIGGKDAPSAWMCDGASDIADALRPAVISTQKVGNDIYYRMRFSGLPDFRRATKLDAAESRKAADRIRESLGNRRFSGTTEMIRMFREGRERD